MGMLILLISISDVRLRSYMELCILVPGISSQHHGSVGPEQVSTADPLSTD
jgi:hypothetical protein